MLVELVKLVLAQHSFASRRPEFGFAHGHAAAYNVNRSPLALYKYMFEALALVVIIVAAAIYGAIRRAKRKDATKPEDIYPHW